MTIEHAAINEVCPLAWKRFQEWCKKPENDKVMEMISTNDLRAHIGYYMAFFMEYAQNSDDIKKYIMSHCLVEPDHMQKQTIYDLFVALERHIKTHETWVGNG